MNKVAVVIPTYNRASLVGRAIRSVLEQTRLCDKIIVVNDGSTDNTTEVLDSFGDRITVINQANAGVSAARNAGVAAAEDYDLIAFLDSDDYWCPKKLECQLPLHDRPGVVLSATNWAWEGREAGPEYDRLGIDRHKVIDESALSALLRYEGHGFFMPTWIVRRDALCQVGLFDTRMKRVEDTRALFRLAFEGHFDLTDYVGLVRSSEIDAVQLTDVESQAYQADYVPATLEVLLETYAKASRESHEIQTRLRRFTAYFLLRHAKIMAAAGEYKTARQRAAEALVYGSKGRQRLQALLLTISPRIYGWLISSKSTRGT